MSILVLANPFSGSGPNRAHMEALIGELAGFGIATHIAWSPAEGRALLADFGAHARAVVAAGGDGSIATVLGMMQEANLLPLVPFATFPMGNENLFAKHFGFARNTRQLAAHLARGATRPADLGLATCGAGKPRLFSLMAGMGLDAEVVRRIEAWRHAPTPDNPQRKHRVTRRSYAPHILNAVLKYPTPPVVLEADGQSHAGALAMVCNLAEYGGGLKFAIHAKDDDGLLDWVLFTKGSAVAGLRYAFSAYLGRHLRRNDVLHGQAKKITVRALGRQVDAQVPAQIDGDGAGTTPIVFEALPGAFRVVETRQ